MLTAPSPTHTHTHTYSFFMTSRSCCDMPRKGSVSSPLTGISLLSNPGCSLRNRLYSCGWVGQGYVGVGHWIVSEVAIPCSMYSLSGIKADR